MSNDFFSLRLLVVSETETCRSLWREGAMLASMPIDFHETPLPLSSADMHNARPDVALIDTNFAQADEVVENLRLLSPSTFIVGFSQQDVAPVPLGGIDAMLLHPGDVDQARHAIDRCIKSRLPTRVLIVDDSSTMRAVVRKILEASRFTLSISDASEGASALECIKSGAVDMVFLDQNMPGLSGIDTLAEIRHASPGVVVVMMTATMDASVADRARAAGAAAFLKKPFYPKDVDAVLRRHHAI